jgi:hypothetical protein
MNSRIGSLAAAALAVTLLSGLAAVADEPADEKEPFGRMTVDEVEKALGRPDVHVYDGNSKSTYKKGHVPGAVNRYTQDIKPATMPAQKDATLIFYCQNTF